MADRQRFGQVNDHAWAFRLWVAVRTILCLILVASGATRGWAREHVVTLVTEEMKPFSYIQDGVVRGFAAEAVTAALDSAGLKYTVDVQPWARAYDRALREENVFVFSMVRTPARESQFVWVANLAPAQVCLFRLATRQDLASITLQTLPERKIATIRGYFTVELLAKWGVPDHSITLFGQEHSGNVLKHLELGRSDFYLGDPLIFQEILDAAGMSGLIVPHGGLVQAGDYYLAAHPETDPELIQRVREAVSRYLNGNEARILRQRYLQVHTPDGW